MNAALKKALEKARGSLQKREATDAEFEKLYPLMHGMMTSTEGEKKGEFRETHTLWVTTGDGLWKCCFADRNEDATLWSSGETFWGMLEALERAIGSDCPDWRAKSDNGTYAKKKKGK